MNSPRPPSSKVRARRRCGEVVLPSVTSQVRPVAPRMRRRRTGAWAWRMALVTSSLAMRIVVEVAPSKPPVLMVALTCFRAAETAAVSAGRFQVATVVPSSVRVRAANTRDRRSAPAATRASNAARQASVSEDSGSAVRSGTSSPSVFVSESGGSAECVCSRRTLPFRSRISTDSTFARAPPSGSPGGMPTAVVAPSGGDDGGRRMSGASEGALCGDGVVDGVQAACLDVVDTPVRPQPTYDVMEMDEHFVRLHVEVCQSPHRGAKSGHHRGTWSSGEGGLCR